MPGSVGHGCKYLNVYWVWFGFDHCSVGCASATPRTEKKQPSPHSIAKSLFQTHLVLFWGSFEQYHTTGFRRHLTHICVQHTCLSLSLSISASLRPISLLAVLISAHMFFFRSVFSVCRLTFLKMHIRWINVSGVCNSVCIKCYCPHSNIGQNYID